MTSDKKLLITCVLFFAFIDLLAAQSINWLPSWNEGVAKQAILNFVQETCDPSSQNYVPPADRIATFDQDGTLWVEHPLYTQAVFALDRLKELASQHPQWQSE